jgi:hypothetical protein
MAARSDFAEERTPGNSVAGLRQDFKLDAIRAADSGAF